jgi:deoxyadenosine/deoxycytidine kinase
MSSGHPTYLVVEGPIGVGKTSLVKRLAQTFDSQPLLEQPEENPFLERFYQSPKHYALPAQLFFLFQRVRQIQELKQRDMFSTGFVADFLLDKDMLFARANLDDDELRLYEQVYTQMKLDLPQPDMVIYLQAPADTLFERVRRRSSPYERLIEREYLHRIADAYLQFFYHYTASPLLVVNAADVNFVESDADFQVLLDYIRRTRSGRHFVNPPVAA